MKRTGMYFRPGVGLIAAFAVVALSGIPTAGASPAKKSATIAALIAGTNVPYLATYERVMKQEAKKLGASITTYSADFDASKQAQQFDTVIAQHPDVIIINAVNAKGIVPSLVKAQQANIPVVASNNGVDPSAQSLVKGYTGPNDTLEGGVSAKLMKQVLHGKGNVAIVMGALGTTPQINRTNGFTHRLNKISPHIKILGRETASWDAAKARAVAASFIARFGSNLNGIFAEDDTMASGAAQAVSDAHARGRIKVVGLGGSTLGFRGVKNGSIAATLIQSPVQDAQLAVQAAVKVANGQSIPKNTYLKPIPITKKNVNKYKPEW